MAFAVDPLDLDPTPQKLTGWAAAKGGLRRLPLFVEVRKLSPKIPRKGSKTLGDILDDLHQ
ncbi:unnamed protein product [Prunus armeniaca]